MGHLVKSPETHIELKGCCQITDYLSSAIDKSWCMQDSPGLKPY